MSRSARVSIGDVKNKEIWIACGICNQTTCHGVLTSIDSSDESPDGDVQVWENYWTVICQGCRTISFCIQSRNSEDLEDDGHGVGVQRRTTTLYPNRIVGRPAMQALGEVPPGVRHVYEETHRALCNDQPILAGIGIRAIVEAVCTERNAGGNTLEKKIDYLAVGGIITQDAATILHSLRFMGNKAAHEIMAHTIDELSTAFNVIEYLLQGVYVMPKQAAKLPSKKPKTTP
jgi:uncharacterized protein DUF4145